MCIALTGLCFDGLSLRLTPRYGQFRSAGRSTRKFRDRDGDAGVAPSVRSQGKSHMHGTEQPNQNEDGSRSVADSFTTRDGFK